MININIVCDHPQCGRVSMVKFSSRKETWGSLLDYFRESGWTLRLDETNTDVLSSYCMVHQPAEKQESKKSAKCLVSESRAVWVAEFKSSTLVPFYCTGRDVRTSLGHIAKAITSDIHDALQFTTKGECEHWIHMNASDLFDAREHAIG